ncbi:hypothetical protein [uncultured Maribacter sp.]|uniref:hypothetical protein n=1 Tax=uncultured Maribacter sp. TaxID=431308 RepID=UPI00260C8737|nr:hypothetical protein [uncultured Maribacter sp.]
MSFSVNAQLFEGQIFCDELINESIFTLKYKTKKLTWYDTYYIEEKTQTKEIDDKEYFEFEQRWDKSDTHKLYLREENGIVYQFEECCEEDTIRYNPEFKKSHKWKTADGKSEYEIISFKGKLNTPYCNYKNLMVIEAKMHYGNYRFYYFKGHGYIGATKDGNLISYLTPE